MKSLICLKFRFTAKHSQYDMEEGKPTAIKELETTVNGRNVSSQPDTITIKEYL